MSRQVKLSPPKPLDEPFDEAELSAERDRLAWQIAKDGSTQAERRRLADVERQLTNLQRDRDRAEAASRGEAVQARLDREAQLRLAISANVEELRDEAFPRLAEVVTALDATLATLETQLVEYHRAATAASSADSRITSARRSLGLPAPSRAIDRPGQSLLHRLDRLTMLARRGKAANLATWERTRSLRSLLGDVFREYDTGEDASSSTTKEASDEPAS